MCQGIIVAPKMDFPFDPHKNPIRFVSSPRERPEVADSVFRYPHVRGK